MRKNLGSIDSCRPFSIGSGPSETGPRLGGRAPQSVAPINPRLRYFLTVPLSGSSQEMSIFTDPSSAFVFGGNAGRILSGGGIEIAIHDSTGRSPDQTSFDSELSAHPIRVGSVEPDVQDEEGIQRPFSGHKLGGKPYLVKTGGQLEASLQSLIDAGFRQALQIDFPGSEDGPVEGSWPFGTGLFHVMLKITPNEFAWRCFWEP